VTLSGIITVTGSASPTGPKDGGTVSVAADGLLTCSAAINAAGGAGTNLVTLQSGANGGAVTLSSAGTFGGVMLVGSAIVADGGSSASAAGGNGGVITLQSTSQPIDMIGSLTARGGPGGGSGNGGAGGRLIASSDAANSGVAGNITLEAGSAIDVSGGPGVLAGSAMNNGITDPGATATTNMAVVFDADRDLTNTGGTQGRISNLGAITATGSTGGDVWYAGLNAAGLVLSSADGVGLNLTGTLTGHFYPH